MLRARRNCRIRTAKRRRKNQAGESYPTQALAQDAVDIGDGTDRRGYPLDLVRGRCQRAGKKEAPQAVTYEALFRWLASSLAGKDTHRRFTDVAILTDRGWL